MNHLAPEPGITLIDLGQLGIIPGAGGEDNPTYIKRFFFFQNELRLRFNGCWRENTVSSPASLTGLSEFFLLLIF